MVRSTCARRRAATASAVLALAAAGCRAPGEERAPDPRYEMIRAEWLGPDRAPSQGWFHFTAGWLDREQAGLDPVGDGIQFGLNGGIDLARTYVTPSLELGIAYAGAHVSLPDTDDVELWRGTVGLRATWYTESWRPYVRGGAFVRWSTQDLEEPLDPYATGVYAGAGADWRYVDGMWFGPSVAYYRSISEDAPGGDAGEILFALGATFRL